MFKQILIINVSRIGDTLLATPAIRAIAHAYPQAEIDFMGHPNRKEVIEGLPFLRHVGGITKKIAPWLGRLHWPGHKKYDLAFVFGYDEPLVAYALRVSTQVAAFRQANDAINRALSCIVEPPGFQSAHAVQQALLLPAAMGIAPSGFRLEYAVHPRERDWAVARLRDDIPLGSTPLIGLQIASFPTKAYRDWPLDSFVQLCDRLRVTHPKAHFLIFGGKEEHLRTESLAHHLGAAATLYAGQLTLRETAALMQQLDLYIGVDTGPTHLMSTFDIPLVGLFHGFSRSELIGPLDHPCFYAVDHPRAGPDCSTDESMAAISVDRVYAAVDRALSEHPPRERALAA